VLTRRLALLLLVVGIAVHPQSAVRAESSSWLDPYREPAARLV
jgi:hypothetical protein